MPKLIEQAKFNLLKRKVKRKTDKEMSRARHIKSTEQAVPPPSNVQITYRTADDEQSKFNLLKRKVKRKTDKEMRARQTKSTERAVSPPSNVQITGNSIDVKDDSDHPVDPEAVANQSVKAGTKQWTSEDEQEFIAVGRTYATLPPDIYEAGVRNGMPYLKRINFSTEELVTFDDSSIDDVLEEVRMFWGKKEKFSDFNFPFRRGVLLYGPPGSGKSCAIKIIANQVIKEGGIGLRFTEPATFLYGMRLIRSVQKEIPVVVIMEDIDALLEDYNESTILNILDGVDGFENVVFIATTNYPEKLESRVKDRPSRFDKRFYVGYPSSKTRKIFLQHLEKRNNGAFQIDDIERWVKDTERFTIAHLKELFVSVALFDKSYDIVLNDLLDMKKKITSGDDNGSVGFR